MDRSQQGSPIAAAFPLVDAAGQSLAPVTARWRVLDEADDALLDWAVAPAPVGGVITCVVPGVITLLTAPATQGLRQVELELTLDGGATVPLQRTYLVSGVSTLAFGVNTFQTYGQGLLLSQEFADMQWPAFARADVERALVEAHGRILRLPVGIFYSDEQSILTVDTEFTGLTGPAMLRDLNPEQVAKLHPKMLKALKRAQVVEANVIMNPSPTQALREQGIISQTVGESSTFFNSSAPLAATLGVDPKTLRELSRWMRYGARIGRR